MNHRVVANGTPLEDRFDNVARLARRAGYAPALFGYTDQGVDPSTVTDPADPRLDTYEGVLPGFDRGAAARRAVTGWLAWLDGLGLRHLDRPRRPRARSRTGPAEHSVSAFLTDRLIEWIDRQDGPWFAHASYFRPHPPYAAAGRCATRYDPDDVGVPIPAADPGSTRSTTSPSAIDWSGPGRPGRPGPRCGPSTSAWSPRSTTSSAGWSTHLRATGQAGRHPGRGHLRPRRAARGPRADREARVLRGELPRSRASSAPPAGAAPPAGWWTRSPRASTCCPRWPSCSARRCRPSATGVSLVPFLDGAEPRSAGAPPPTTNGTGATWSWAHTARRAGADRRLERYNLAVERTDTHAYVQFADGSWLCFDLAADPDVAHDDHRDPAVVLPAGPVHAGLAVDPPGRDLHPAPARPGPPRAVAGAAPTT